MCREQDATAQQDATEAVNTVMAHVQSERFVADLPHTSKAPSEHLLGGKRASYLYQALVAKSSKFPEKISALVFEELYRFLAATERGFLKIRSTDHLLRIIRSLSWLREKQSVNRFPSHKRAVLFRLFRAKLQFDFGQRDVLSLVISVGALQPSERFDFQHILRACCDIFPNLDLVPRSCFSFYHPEDKTVSYYVELERQDGYHIPSSDCSILKKELQTRLEAAIEHVDHHLDLPENDEDTIRNSVLLSQQLTEVDGPPQIVVHFQGQTNKELVFLITYMRVVDADKKDSPLAIS